MRTDKTIGASHQSECWLRGMMIAFVAPIVFVSAATFAAPSAADPLRPFLQTHCVSCHDKESSKGGLDLETMPVSFGTRDESAAWTRIFDRIDRGEMPPAKKPRPAEAEKRATLEWLGKSIISAEQRRQELDGRTAWRRLNRNEYQNTLHDLLGIDIDLKGMLPEDGASLGFDNIDTALDVSAIHIEKYLEAADAALDAVLLKTVRPDTKKARYSYLDDVKGVAKSEQILKLPDAAVFTNESYPPKVLNTFKAPTPGRYRFRMSIYAHQSAKPLPAMIYTGSQQVTRGKTEMTQVFDAPPGKPTVCEWVDLLDRGDTIRVVTKGPSKGWADSAATYAGPGLAVQWVEIEGPLVTAWPPAGYQALVGELDLTKGTIEDASRILRSFMPRAFRRPVPDAEVTPYVELVRAKLSAGGRFDEALRFGLKAVLVSPNFLYLSAAPGKLDDFALATRLSYFLWSTTPDQQLSDLAAKHELGKPAVLRQQVERMLGDPRSAAFTENFTGQWLKLREIRATMPDKQLYPEFDSLLEWSMVTETHRFFDELLKNDMSLLNFVHSDFATINSRLAEHYGIPGVDGLNFRKVALKPEWHRGGVLTQASVLKVTANGTNTSPVVRGVFFLDRILGRPAPPPPKNVPAIEPDIRGATTIRAQLEKHRNVESCAICHNRIDPPGAAMESYDVIGGWRGKYRVAAEWNKRALGPDGKKLSYGLGQACQTDAVLPDGSKFADLDEFKKLLLADEAGRDQIARGISEKLLMYATGHAVEFTDRESANQIVATIRQKNYGLRSLVHEVVQSPTFQRK